MRNAEEIHPEWQEREVGETIFLHPVGDLEVTRCESPRALGIHNWGTLVLEPSGPERSRVLVRGGTPPGLSGAGYALLDTRS